MRWWPKSLWDSCIRQAVLALSSGADPELTISAARTRFMSEAANPGLDLLDGDPWTVASDWCAMLATTLTAMSRATLLQLSRVSPVQLDSSTSWQPSSFADESGTLHRWVSTDAIDADFLTRQFHSWHVFGDIAVCDAPMTLHVIVIGQQRGGRRASPWARAWKHPVIANRYKFQRNDGKGGHRALAGAEWRALYFADNPKSDPSAWVDVMQQEGVIASLLHHIAIAQPSEESARQCREQILDEGERMRGLLEARSPRRMDSESGPEPAMALPMARGACDANHVACPWQQACYREQPAEGISSLALYQLRTPIGPERIRGVDSSVPCHTIDRIGSHA